jgi:hypothetical protein
VECFKNGGGVPYTAFGRFQEVMAEDSGQTVVAALMDSIIPHDFQNIYYIIKKS